MIDGGLRGFGRAVSWQVSTRVVWAVSLDVDRDVDSPITRTVVILSFGVARAVRGADPTFPTTISVGVRALRRAQREWVLVLRVAVFGGFGRRIFHLSGFGRRSNAVA